MKTLELNQMETFIGGSDCPSFDNCVNASAGLGLLLFGAVGSILGMLGGLQKCTCDINNK